MEDRLFNLPFRVEIPAVLCLGAVLLLQLSAVLVELLVVDRGDLAHDLLRPRTRAVLRLRQVHCGRVHMDLTTCADDGTSRTLLRVDYCLGLGLRLCLSSESQTTYLIHQGGQVLVPIRRYNLCSDLLESVRRCLQHR